MMAAEKLGLTGRTGVRVTRVLSGPARVGARPGTNSGECHGTPSSQIASVG